MTTAPPSVKRNSIFTQPIHSPRARWESLLHSPTSALSIFTPPSTPQDKVGIPSRVYMPPSTLQPHPKINTCATQPLLVQETPSAPPQATYAPHPDLPAPSRVPACPRHALCRAVKVQYLPNSVPPRLSLGGCFCCTFIPPVLRACHVPPTLQRRRRGGRLPRLTDGGI